MHTTRLASILFFASITALTACGESTRLDVEDKPTNLDEGERERPSAPEFELDRSTLSPLAKFASREEHDAYIDGLLREHESNQADSYGYEGDGGGNNASPESANSADSAGEPPANENITNNQEEGVDEGGIVKNIGDHLVVLRQGRLYAVSVDPSAPMDQTSSLRVAPTEDLNDGVWYDEMLVKGDQIYVIGYRYSLQVSGEGADDGWGWGTGATEVSSFELGVDGQLVRGETVFFESNDYFSGSNYASRMIDGKLVVYMPYGAVGYDGQQQRASLQVPDRLDLTATGEIKRSGPLFKWSDVTRPMLPPRGPTFHTVLTCELPENLGFTCTSRALLSEWHSQFYVSADDVYLWGDEHVFAFPMLGGQPVAHAIKGYPSDQFAFKAADGKLFAAVLHDEQDLDGAYRSELVMLRLERSAFDSIGEQALDATNTDVIASSLDDWLYPDRQKYVGDRYIASVRDWDSNGSMLHIYDRATRSSRSEAVDGYVSRIESVGSAGALIAAQSSDGLTLRTLAPGAASTLSAGLLLPGSSEGESRSHGYFFKPGADGGMFGLAVINPYVDQGEDSYDYWWGSSVANIAFFDVTGAGDISKKGVVSSTSDASGQCETSCVDWYGNTRPIFLPDRLIALMGSELTEVEFSQDGELVVLGTVLMGFGENSGD